MTLTAIEETYGPILIQKKEPAFVDWLRLEKLILIKALALRDNEEKQTRLDWINQYVKDR
jgi:hypothetical protein